MPRRIFAPVFQLATVLLLQQHKKYKPLTFRAQGIMGRNFRLEAMFSSAC